MSGLGRFGVRGRFFFGLDTVGAGLIVVVGSEHRGSLGWRGEHRDSRILYSPHRMVKHRDSRGSARRARQGGARQIRMIVVAGSIGVGFGQSDIESDCSGYHF